MALQGTLDTFELPDVLRLLASTRKTGRLTLRTDRGEGAVWLAEGQLVAAAAGGTDEVGDALFDLLRAHEGSFAFEPGDEPAAAMPPADVEPLLATAEDLLVEWRSIEAVVPSVHAWVALRAELPGSEITVDAETWRLVATIGSGLTVADLGAALGLGEVAVSRVVRDLVSLGLGAVTAAPAPPVGDPVPEAPVHDPFEPAPPALAGADELASFERAVEPAPYEPAADERVAADDAFEPVVGPSYDTEAPPPLFAVTDVEAPLPAPAPDPTTSPFAVAPQPVDDADEVARHLALLSPEAAQAVAAASAHEDTGPAADVEGAGEDEPVNRGLLLKFLGSVKA